jgi:hypothetical protein
MTIGQCLGDRRRKGIKPERAIVLPWDRQGLGELNHLFFFTYEIRNIPFNIQFNISIILLELCKSDYFFSPKSGKIIY